MNNIFIEFNINDIDYIRTLPNFLDVYHYRIYPQGILHRREFGCIETKDAIIRFLGNSLERALKNDNDTPKNKEASKTS